MYGSKHVDGASAALDALGVTRRDEIRLVEEEPVGKAHLRGGLVHGVLRLDGIKMLPNMLGVDQRDDAVQTVGRGAVDGVCEALRCLTTLPPRHRLYQSNRL